MCWLEDLIIMNYNYITRNNFCEYESRRYSALLQGDLCESAQFNQTFCMYIRESVLLN